MDFLIDGNKLFDTMDKCDSWESQDDKERALGFINGAKKEEVIRVVEANWVRNSPNSDFMRECKEKGLYTGGMGENSIFYTCSHCGSIGSVYLDHCPTCLARMRKSEHGTNEIINPENCPMCNQKKDKMSSGGIKDFVHFLHFYYPEIFVTKSEEKMLFSVLSIWIKKQNYCPVCGNKIRKEKEDESRESTQSD